VSESYRCTSSRGVRRIPRYFQSNTLDALCLNNGQSLSELCELLDMARQSVTKHLLILERAGLIAVKWDSREKLHYLNPVPIQETCGRWVSKYERHRLKALDALKAGLETDSERHEEAKRKVK
jgi:DNA-binding transcriptional ArsR family regulator